MGKWLLIAIGTIIIGAIVAVFIGQARENSKVNRLGETLIQSAFQPVNGTVKFDSFSEFPPPVARYFRHILTDGQKLIRTAKLHQSGVLRTSTTTPTILSNDMSGSVAKQNWARLIQKIYEVDPLICPKCQDQIKIISIIRVSTSLNLSLSFMNRKSCGSGRPLVRCFPIPIMGPSLIPWIYRGTQSGSSTSRAVMILCFSVHGLVSLLRIDFIRDTILTGNENQTLIF